MGTAQKTGLLGVAPLNLGSMSAQVAPDGQVQLKGSVSLRAPAEALQPFLKTLHRAAVSDQVKELLVDITEVSFMNSSSIRLLVTWLDWILAEPSERRYVLHFQTNHAFTWQRTTLSVLKTLDAQHIRISAKG